MSSTSLNDLSSKNLDKSPSQNNGSEQNSMDESNNSIRYTEDKSWIRSMEQSSIYENSSSNRSVRLKISPLSIAVNSVDEIVELATELENVETSTKCLQTGLDSFTSHSHSNYDHKLSFESNNVLEAQLAGDLHLPLAEEQDAKVNACANKNLCAKKGFTNNGDPIENLVSATLAFREASHNQCDLLKAQTSAINRLAMAIEDQNVMMSRFHNIVQKTNTKNSGQ